MTPDRLPPYSEEAERGVLGCILWSPQDSLSICAMRLEPESFYDLRHQTIYTATQTMAGGGLAVDLVTLQQCLKDNQMLDRVGGISYLSEVMDATPSAANLDYYLDIVVEK